MKNIKVKRSAQTTYTLRPERFCTYCGAKGIYEDDLDDYYQGNGTFCFHCSDARPHELRDSGECGGTMFCSICHAEFVAKESPEARIRDLEARNAELEETLSNIRRFYPDKSESSPLRQTEEARNLYHGNWIRAEARVKELEYALKENHESSGLESALLIAADNAKARDAAEARAKRYEEALDVAKQMRIYCLGSDASTCNMIERFDAAMKAIQSAAPSERGET